MSLNMHEHQLALLNQLLSQRFRLPSFRKGQLDILKSVLKGQDTMAVMPTGGGKSLCYQLPALFCEGLVVVVCPLIALMKDQVRLLNQLGIPAGCLYSSQDIAEKQKIFSEIYRQKHYILYLSPERVQNPGFANWIRTQKVSLFAIDEAHCVSQWGPEFRQDYHRLDLLRELRPDVPILALTATATPTVLEDVVKRLKLRTPYRHVYGFYRPNLFYQVEICEDEYTKQEILKSGLRQYPEGRVLIYCGTRNQTEELCNLLSKEFRGVDYYHAGMSSDQRTRTQTDYENGTTRILAATNAFGMGIDHPDVRLVVHYQMPATIESFYQEMGRAGRDGRDSTCLLLYSRRDKGLHSFFIRQSDHSGSGKSAESARYIDQRWRALDTITQFAEGGECRHAGIITYFRDTQRIKSCGHCDMCDSTSKRRVLRPATTKVSKKLAALETATRVRRTKSKSKTTDSDDELAPLSKPAELRMEILKTWRKEFADSKDMPAFLVFSNKTMRDIAVKAPRSLSDLEKVYGFGPHKLEHLGPHVLKALKDI